MLDEVVERVHFVYVIEKVSCYEFYFTQHPVNFGIMLCTGNFDRVNIDGDD